MQLHIHNTRLELGCCNRNLPLFSLWQSSIIDLRWQDCTMLLCWLRQATTGTKRLVCGRLTRLGSPERPGLSKNFVSWPLSLSTQIDLTADSESLVVDGLILSLSQRYLEYL